MAFADDAVLLGRNTETLRDGVGTYERRFGAPTIEDIYGPDEVSKGWKP
jgi:hypothetical protein